MIDDSNDDSKDGHRDSASPPCYQHQFDDTALIAALNTLVENERAGARGLIEMRAACRDPLLAELLDDVARDEARFCAMLARHVESLGAAPSRATGGFLDKLLARESQAEQLMLLDRGQAAVVRSLDELLELPLEQALRRDLEEMRTVHLQNIQRCARFST